MEITGKFEISERGNIKILYFHPLALIYPSFDTTYSLTPNYDESKKMANDSQIVRAKENLNLSHGGPSQIHALGTNPLIEVLGQGLHCVLGLIRHHTIKEVTMVINRDNGFTTRRNAAVEKKEQHLYQEIICVRVI